MLQIYLGLENEWFIWHQSISITRMKWLWQKMARNMYNNSTGVEDKENWHGKPLPKDMAEQIIEEIVGKIQNKKKLSPTLPQDDAPAVNIKNVKMPSPPNYKIGNKVL